MNADKRFNIPYAKHEITEEDIAAVSSAMASGFISGGQQQSAFEANFSEYVGSEHAVAVSSCTAGLHLAVAAMDVPSDKTVLVPSLTFAATANAVLYSGAKVEFVDIDPATLLMDLPQLEAKIEKNPGKYAGVIAVDYAGYPIDTESLSNICRPRGLWTIIDAAHSLGAVSVRGGNEVKSGSNRFVDASVFSFHPAKHITTGEGGMVTTNRPDLYERIKLTRSHAMDKSGPKSAQEGWFYSIERLGYNYRMNEMQAALGVSQLKRADAYLERRREIAVKYDQELADTGLTLPITDIENKHAYHLYIIQSQNRKVLYDGLREKGIFTQVHYVPLHLQPLYRDFDGAKDLPSTDAYYASCLSLPMYPTLADEEQDYVINMIKELTAKTKP